MLDLCTTLRLNHKTWPKHSRWKVEPFNSTYLRLTCEIEYDGTKLKLLTHIVDSEYRTYISDIHIFQFSLAAGGPAWRSAVEYRCEVIWEDWGEAPHTLLPPSDYIAAMINLHKA